MNTPLASLPRVAFDWLNYVAAGGAIWSFNSAMNANEFGAWGAAIIAVVAAGSGWWRERKRNKIEDARFVKQTARHELWDAFLTDYRMKKIAETGVDPFADGVPPLDFTERIEQIHAEQESAEPDSEVEPEEDHKRSWPKWPKIAEGVTSIFRRSGRRPGKSEASPGPE
jgi:hypothetical protein